MKKMNTSVLLFGLVILTLNLVFINASDSTINEDSDLINPVVVNKVRVNRRTNCGLRTFQLLRLICTNEYKPIERQEIKDLDTNYKLLNYGIFKKRSIENNLLNDQQFNLKRLVDLNNLQDSISDVHVHNNPNYHRMKRSLIRDCCHQPCSLDQLISYCPTDFSL